jgi:hypothetical protein
MKILLVASLLSLAGCAGLAGRYQLATNASGNVVWRLDTQTGALEGCGYEAAKPVCHPFPPPAVTK